MTRIWLEGEALDDLTISSHSASAAGHETMSRIPGAALLGAAARTLYERLSQDDAWTVFHSGCVRFGDLRPFYQGCATVPMPRSWHRLKRTPSQHATSQVADDTDTLSSAHDLWDLALLEDEKPAADLKALRSGYVTDGGLRVQPRLASHTKSAREPNERRAREQFLFTSQGLAVGNRFGGWLTWDNDVDRALIEKVCEVLTGHGPVRVGRSRSAEFGRLRLTADPKSNPRGVEAADPVGKRLVVLLLSDVAFNDPLHGPTLRPTAEMLGLPAGRMVPERSFVAARRYRPFNGYRRRPDLARTVLVAGSVLAIDLDETLAPGEAARISNHRVGMHTAEGLGEILVSPMFQCAARPQFKPAIPSTVPTPLHRITPDQLDDPLARWAWSRAQSRRSRRTANAAGDTATDQIVALLKKALDDDRGYNRLELWPSPTQWNQLAQRLEQVADYDELKILVHDVTQTGVAKRTWMVEIWRPKSSISLDETPRQPTAGNKEQGLSISLGSLICEVAEKRSRGLSQTIVALRRICRNMTQWLHAPNDASQPRGDA